MKKREVTKEKVAENITVSSQQLARIFQVSGKTICEWAKLGMPKAAYGKFDLFSSVDWWRENINQGPEDRDPNITDTKKKYWSAKADNEELKRDKTKGKLIDRADVVQEWAWRASELRSSLRGLASRLPQVLEGLDIHAMRETIRKQMDEILESYCRHGRFTPSPEGKKCRSHRKK